MPPKVIVHSSVSLDHAIIGYDIDIGLREREYPYIRCGGGSGGYWNIHPGA